MTKKQLPLSDEFHALRAAKASGDMTRIRNAALELLASIHKRMEGVSEEEVDAAVTAARAELRERR